MAGGGSTLRRTTLGEMPAWDLETVPGQFGQGILELRGSGCGLEGRAEAPRRQRLGPTDSSSHREGEGKQKPAWGSLKPCWVGTPKLSVSQLSLFTVI